MGTPSPFEVARQVSNNFGDTFQQNRDVAAIDRILAQSANDPQQLQANIGQILSQVSPERQPQAIKVLEDRFKAIQAQKDVALKKEAAKTAGFTYGAPPQVQAQEVKGRQQMDAYNQVLGGDAPQGQPSIQGHPDQTQAQALDTPGAVAPSAQKPQASKGGGIRDVPEKELIAMHAIPSLKPAAEAEQKRRLEERNREVEFHKESAKYDEELLNKTKVAKAQLQTIDDIEKAVKSGNVKPASLANVFKGLGKIGDKISEALINGDEATLQASIPQLLDGWKDVFGVRLTDADLKLLQDKLPSMGKSPEANTAILKVLRKYGEMNLLRGDIARDIKKANGGIRPLGYADQIEERFDEMIVPVKIINPNNGNIIDMPAYKVGDAIKAGAKLAPMEG